PEWWCRTVGRTPEGADYGGAGFPRRSVDPEGTPMPAVNPALPRALAVAARHHSLITAAQCRSVGLSRAAVKRLVDRGVWTREAPGLYRVAGAPRTWTGRALAIALATGDGALVSHRSAAHLWGLQGF